MLRSVSVFLSALFHPLIMPLFTVYLMVNALSYFSFRLNDRLTTVVYLIVFVFTFVLPAVSAFMLYKMGVMDSLEMPARSTRKIPYLAAAISYTVAYYLLQKLNLPVSLMLAILGGCVTLILVMLINLFWKISAHATAAGGVLGALLGLSFRYMMDLSPQLYLLIIMCGLVGFARLAIKAHTPGQVYAGLLLGSGVQFFFQTAALWLGH